jgi:hypothetical protein
VTKPDELVDMIVDIVSQDYETYQLIEEELADWAAKKGVQFSNEAFRNALASSVQHGLVQAFRYNDTQQNFEAVPWEASNSERLYYLATKRGLAALT